MSVAKTQKAKFVVLLNKAFFFEAACGNFLGKWNSYITTRHLSIIPNFLSNKIINIQNAPELISCRQTLNDTFLFFFVSLTHSACFLFHIVITHVLYYTQYHTNTPSTTTEHTTVTQYRTSGVK